MTSTERDCLGTNNNRHGGISITEAEQFLKGSRIGQKYKDAILTASLAGCGTRRELAKILKGVRNWVKKIREKNSAKCEVGGTREHSAVAWYLEYVVIPELDPTRTRHACKDAATMTEPCNETEASVAATNAATTTDSATATGLASDDAVSAKSTAAGSPPNRRKQGNKDGERAGSGECKDKVGPQIPYVIWQPRPIAMRAASY